MNISDKIQNYQKIVKYLKDREEEGKILPKTFQEYLKHFAKINQKIGIPSGIFDLDAYDANSSLLTTWFDSYNRNIQTLLKTMFMGYKIIGIKPPQFLHDINQIYKDQVHQTKSQAPSKELPFTSFDQVRHVFDIWNQMVTPQSPHKIITQYLVLAFYTLLPPMRPSELCFLRIVDHLEDQLRDGNYLDLETRKMYFKYYKTSRTYGMIELDVPDQLIQILTKFFNCLKQVNGYRYPFTTKTGEIIKPNNFTSFFKGIYGLKEASPTDLRNLYVSSLGEVTQERRAEIAKYMKNSVSNQYLIYSKYNKTLYPDK